VQVGPVEAAQEAMSAALGAQVQQGKATAVGQAMLYLSLLIAQVAVVAVLAQ
jgi:hypothetical protein